MTILDHIRQGVELDAEIKRLKDKLNRQYEYFLVNPDHPDTEHNADVWLQIERKYRKKCDELHEIEMELAHQ